MKVGESRRERDRERERLRQTERERERERENHKMKVYKMLSLHTLILNEVKLGIAARQAVETISQLASLRS